MSVDKSFQATMRIYTINLLSSSKLVFLQTLPLIFPPHRLLYFLEGSQSDTHLLCVLLGQILRGRWLWMLLNDSIVLAHGMDLKSIPFSHLFWSQSSRGNNIINGTCFMFCSARREGRELLLLPVCMSLLAGKFALPLSSGFSSFAADEAARTNTRKSRSRVPNAKGASILYHTR